jgi:hypothetical protein
VNQDTGLTEEHLTVEIPTEIQAGRFATSWGCSFALTASEAVIAV